MPARSYLYAPGNRPDLMEKAARSGADAVILDLEDAVPAAEKAGAAETVRSFLQAGPVVPAFVRLNAGRTGLEEVERVAVAELAGVLLPKAEDPAVLAAIDGVLAARAVPDAIVQPLIESVAGLFAMDEMARASGRIRRFAFGAGDFVRDLRAQPTPERTETLYARQHIVARSRFLGLDAPVAHVFAAVRDLEGLRRACAEDRALGFGARSCIHPSQVAPINAAFAPTAEQRAQAGRILDAYAQAQAEGRGALLLEDGTFVDEAVALRARDVLEAAP